MLSLRPLSRVALFSYSESPVLFGNWVGVRSTRKADKEAREVEGARRLKERSGQAVGELLPLFQQMSEALPHANFDEIEVYQKSIADLGSCSGEAQLLILDIKDKSARDKLVNAIQCLYAWDDASALGTRPWQTAGIVARETREILGAIRRDEPIPDTPELDSLNRRIEEYWEIQRDMAEDSAFEAARERKADAEPPSEARSTS